MLGNCLPTPQRYPKSDQGDELLFLAEIGLRHGSGLSLSIEGLRIVIEMESWFKFLGQTPEEGLLQAAYRHADCMDAFSAQPELNLWKRVTGLLNPGFTVVAVITLALGICPH